MSTCDLTAEGLLPITAVAKRLGLNPSTVRRWCTGGAKVPAGERVVLEHIRLPGKLLTTLPAVDRFTAALGAPAPVPEVVSPAQRDRAARKAKDELRRLGV